MPFLNFHPPVIAHRGASGYAPENTLAAFKKAMQLGLHWIEFDVMQAACGEPIIFHDDLLDRTTNGKGEVNRLSYEALSKLDAGTWFNTSFSGEKIPTLRQVIQFLETTKLSANVEIKAEVGQEERLVKRVLKEMADYLSSETSCILFSSFSIDALKSLRKHAPDCLLGLLLHEWQADWKEICASLQCVSVHVNETILTPEYAYDIKSMGKRLLSYTVNDSKRAEELYSWGVDAVFSDVPDKIL